MERLLAWLLAPQTPQVYGFWWARVKPVKLQ